MDPHVWVTALLDAAQIHDKNIVFVRFQTKGMADDRLPPLQLVKLTLQVPLGPYAMGCRRLQVAGLSGMHETCRRV